MASIPGQSQVPGLPQPPPPSQPPHKQAKKAIQRRVGLKAPARAARRLSVRTVLSAARRGNFWGLVKSYLPMLAKQHAGRKSYRNHGFKGSQNGYTGWAGKSAPWKKLW